MDESAKLLLDGLSCALRGENVSWQAGTVSSWPALRHLAMAHYVLPLLAHAAWDSPAAASDPAAVKSLCAKARELVTAQARRTGDFLLLYRELQQRGLTPIIMKGIVCRSLYPCPELRPSVDEDLLAQPGTFLDCHRALLSLGFHILEEGISPETAAEISYRHPETFLYLELHRYPFPPDSEAYGDFNGLFADAAQRAVPLSLQETTLYTLSPTDHLLFLICHAHKHFLHSGVGIRQICDIGIFAEHYRSEIDWQRVYQDCSAYRIEYIAAAFFRIAERHLGFSMPPVFSDLQVDEMPLLEDILSGGLYGTQDEDRLHSGTLTLDAVAAERSGRRRRGLLATLFPSAPTLATRYPYLRKKPWLLPLAWLQRAFGYLKKRDLSAGSSIRIGEQRIDMLRQYHVID